MIQGISEAINIRDFGAFGDGVSDDTDALKRAAAYEGEVFFPAGIYILREQLDADAQLHWRGSGESTVIKLMPYDQSRPEEVTYENGDVKTVYNVSMLSMICGDMLEVRSMVFDAGKYGYESDIYQNGSSINDHVVGIYVSDSTRVVLDDVTVRNALIEGVYIEGTDDIRVTHCRFCDNGFRGVDSSGMQICRTGSETDIIISDCIFNNNGFNGLLLTSVYGAAVNNIVCRGNRYEGVALWGGSSYCTLSNIVSHSNRGGITFKRSAGPGYDEPDAEKELYAYSIGNTVNGLVTTDNDFGILWGCAGGILISGWVSTDSYTHCLLYKEPEQDITGIISCSHLVPGIRSIKDECNGYSLFQVIYNK